MRTDSRLMQGALVSALLACAVGCDSKKSSPSDAGFDFGNNNPNVIVCCGDSITEGGFPSVLAGMTGKTTINLGVGGHKSSNGVGEVGRALQRYSPGYVILLYGANDIIHQVNPNVTIGNLRSMIQRAKANGSIVIIGTLTPMYSSYGIFMDDIRKLNDAIVKLASEEGARIARVDRAFGGNRDLIGADGLHPSAAGRDVIADAFAGNIF